MRVLCAVFLPLVMIMGCSVERGGLRSGGDGGPWLDAGDAGYDVDAFVPPVDLGPRDAYVPPVDLGLDAFEPPIDLGPPDAYVPPPDLGTPDAFVPPPDLGPPDAYVPRPDLGPVDLGPPPCVGGTTRCAGPQKLDTCEDARWVQRTCDLGCSAVGTAHCAVMVPSNIGAGLIVDGGNVTIDANVTWNTTACTGGGLPGMPTRVTQTGGGEVCVVRVRNLTINGTVRVQGPLPLIVLAQEAITITGTLDVSAYGNLEGPGGGVASTASVYATGPSPGMDGVHAGTYSDSGGGGGGFSGAGGTGGVGDRLSGGSGGAAVASNLTPLVGGSGGGTGGRSGSRGIGGAGGGVVQLSALVAVRVTGSILAGGGGGHGGLDGVPSDGNIGAGGGGGSGGAILIESPIVEIGGTLRASGGGGGGAASCYGAGDAGNGVDGATVSGAPSGGARGGTCSGGFFGGAGGSGGANATLSGTNGDPNTMGGANGAGGGGAAGTLVIRTPTATLPAHGPLSPSVTPGIQALPLLTI